MIATDCDLEKYLNNFLPKLFYEVECNKQKVTVRVPGPCKDRVYSASRLCKFCSCQYKENKKNGNV